MNIVRRKNVTLSLVASLAVVATAWAQNNNIVEEVAWVVGDQPIYKSEIEEAYQQMLYEKTPVDGDPYCVVPEQIAVNKLFLHQAEIDTVEVQDAMVVQNVESRLNYLITNLGSREKVEEYFHKSYPELREDMMDMMRDQFKIQQVQQSLTKNLKTTPSDVRRYFDALPSDSIPFVPLQVEAQIITVNPVIPQQEIDEVKSRLRSFADQVNRGESDFSTLAILYSQDGSSMHGGELGFRGRGQLVPEFAAVAFNLNDSKKVSKIVETEYGYHIIQLIEKRGDRINCRHILLRPKVSDRDLEKGIVRLDSLRKDINAGKITFEDAVFNVSQDKDTRFSRGIMVNEQNGTVRFEMSQLPQEVGKVVNRMNVGEISEPFIMKDPKRDRDIVAIVKLTARIDAHKANLADDYQLVKNMYENAEKSEMVKKWIDRKIKETYVKIEDGWRGCDFKHEGWLKK